MSYKTEQEVFWAGEFGSEYIARNAGEDLLASNIVFFARALARSRGVGSCIEFGANIGMNLKALRLLYPRQDQHAVEINDAAAVELDKFLPSGHVHRSSMLEFSPKRTWDLAFVKGVLIHIHPDWLERAYQVLHDATARYLLVCEYYNPTPQAIRYRGHDDRLFKRDFCSEIMEQHRDLKLIDYGFTYHRDPQHPQDDITWFLMERQR